MATLTVFTPAYNRAHTLPRTYESLKRQSCKDFLWMIVDDGSKDGTAELVKTWQEADNGFAIVYLYKENGGMHTAHNFAYERIETELCTCIDSDDEMAPGAVEKILRHWETVKNSGVCGIVGLDADINTGKIAGTRFPDGMKTCTLSGFYASGGKGDKKLVYRSDLIRQTPPYPVFPGEKYVGLDYKYRTLELQYPLSVLNEVLCNVEYQVDGSSNNMFRQYLNNPRGFAFLRKFYMEHPVSKKRLVMDCIHYCSSSQICHNRAYIKESPRKLLTVLCTPLGWMLTAYIRHQVARMKHGWDQGKTERKQENAQ